MSHTRMRSKRRSRDGHEETSIARWFSTTFPRLSLHRRSHLARNWRHIRINLWSQAVIFVSCLYGAMLQMDLYNSSLFTTTLMTLRHIRHFPTPGVPELEILHCLFWPMDPPSNLSSSQKHSTKPFLSWRKSAPLVSSGLIKYVSIKRTSRNAVHKSPSWQTFTPMLQAVWSGWVRLQSSRSSSS